MDEAFNLDSENILASIITIPIMYLLLIFYVRILGKRSTSELNNFDWIVTVSLGSIFASTVILKSISIYEGGISILILLLLQFGVTTLTCRWEGFRKIVKATPKLLLFDGEFIDETMNKERVLKTEIYAEIRRQGYYSESQIYAAVLETNSKISVIPKNENVKTCHSLKGVHGLPQKLKSELEA